MLGVGALSCLVLAKQVLVWMLGLAGSNRDLVQKVMILARRKCVGRFVSS